MSGSPRMTGPLRLALVLGGVACPAFLAAQSVSGHAVIAAPRSDARVSGVTTREGGVWAGLTVALAAGRFTLSATGLRGTLTPSDASTLPKSEVGEASLSARYRLRSWLAGEMRYAARAFSSATGFERWDMLGIGAAASQELGSPALKAYANLAFLPVVHLRHQESAQFGIRGGMGITVTPERFPVAIGAAYEVERFHFPPSAAHAEQFEAFALWVGVRVRRQAGRWVLTGGDKQ